MQKVYNLPALFKGCKDYRTRIKFLLSNKKLVLNFQRNVSKKMNCPVLKSECRKFNCPWTNCLPPDVISRTKSRNLKQNRNGPTQDSKSWKTRPKRSSKSCRYHLIWQEGNFTELHCHWVSAFHKY